MNNKEKTKELQKHQRCKYYTCGILDNPLKHYCSPGAKTLGEKLDNRHEINVDDCEKCSQFKSKYIEYPITVQEMDVKDPKAWGVCFDPVKVRLCEDDKTYFGILLGNFPWMMHVTYNEDKEKLEVSTITNPCILLPEQKRIVFGAESWWCRINPGDDISDITDDDIENTWYVELLKGMKSKNE